MSRQLDQTLSDAAARNLSVAATLEWLADMELETRRNRAIDRRFKQSRLQMQPSIDAFDFQHHKTRLQNKTRILRLLDLHFMEKGTSIIIIGKPPEQISFTSMASSGKRSVRSGGGVRTEMVALGTRLPAGACCQC